MRPGLHIHDNVVGTGDEAVRGKVVVINLWTYPALDPTLPRIGRHNRRWGLLINTEVAR